MPKFDIHKVSDEDIPEIRSLIEEKRSNFRLSKKTKKKLSKKEFFYWS